MRVSIVLCLAAMELGACGAESLPLTSQEKARFLTETIEEVGVCGSFRNRLADHSTDAAAIDLIYGEAKKAGCLKRDI
jgi:hypothetical protein